MRSRNTDRLLDGPAPGRRRFLQLLGAAPLAAQTLWLIACGGGDESAENPYAGRADVDAGDGPGEAAETPEAGGAAQETGRATSAESGGSADAPAASGTDTAASGGDAKLVTEIPAMQPTVDALKYTHQSTTEGQRCDNCQFYTAQGGGRGKCQLFTQGLVEAEGWCSSWTKKIETG